MSISSVVLRAAVGPELYLHDNRSSENSDVARSSWRNFNTWLALLATNAGAQTIPILANKIGLARVTLVMALEYSPQTRLGKNVDLHVPAAAAWFRIAGDQIEQLCKDGSGTMNPGDLWTGQGGEEVCDIARFNFWKQRMLDVGYKETSEKERSSVTSLSGAAAGNEYQSKLRIK